ncbi:hypothetical protein [Prevotella sp. oral taxon 820]|uniref:hypothetical protein n=1 Tax=Prevotella sp. oral taxon 820 TaxID=2081962 RepID=UPI0011B21744|nr:hypothetical protein [Prevotella sp. oral taxon 820]
MKKREQARRRQQCEPVNRRGVIHHVPNPTEKQAITPHNNGPQPRRNVMNHAPTADAIYKRGSGT